MIKVEALTTEQIQTMQVDEMLRTLGLIERAVTQANCEIITATEQYYEAKRNLENIKNIKNSLVERARIIKTIVSNA